MLRRLPTWLTPAVAAVAILVTLAAALITVVVGSSLGAPDSSLADAPVGACFTRPADVDDATLGLPVDCVEPHTLEVIARLTLAPVAESGPFDEQVAEGCRAAFERYAGIPVDEVAERLQLLRYAAGEMEAGSTVLCTASRADGEPLDMVVMDNGPSFVVTREPGEGSGPIPVAELQVGDCLDEVDGAITAVPVVPCAEPHDREVFRIYSLAADDPADGSFPGRDTVASRARAGCLDAFEGYVGEPWATSPLDSVEITPSRSSWDEGDRQVICLLYRLDGRQMTKSRQAASA